MFFVMSCITAFLGLCSLWAWRNRSPLDEALSPGSQGTFIKLISSFGYQLIKLTPSWYDSQWLDTSLRLAGKNLSGEFFMGISVVIVAAGFLVGEMVSSLSGWGVWLTIGAPLILLGIWWGSLLSEAKKTREDIALELISWSVLELQESVSSGITDPEEAALRQAAQDERKLAKEFAIVVLAMDTNKPLYEAFYNHFVKTLDIDEALDLAMLFEDSKVLGTPIAKNLESVNQMFLEERRYRFRAQVNKLVTELAVVMALVLTLAAGLILGGPTYLSTMEFVK